MKARTLHSIDAIDAATWDALVAGGSPFFDHAFLRAMEATGAVGPGTGWAPRHLLLVEGETPVAACAAWEKRNSNAEFVFDWAWADAAARAGIPYYPKLVVTAPFSPVGGARMHLGAAGDAERRGVLRAALAEAALESARSAGMSGVHWLFVAPEEAETLAGTGYALRHTVQFHWSRRPGEATFADFLGRFDAKKRHQIRRERRLVAEAGVTTRVLTGDALTPALAPLLWRLYTATVDKFVWGQRYLNAAVFETLLETWRENLVVVLAERGGEVVGGTVNAARGGVMYGRYWGALADVDCLHFEVCSYAGVEYCLQAGIDRFEAGAGGGGHKYGRGFDPAVTVSAHRIFHPGLHRAVAAFAEEEKRAIAAEFSTLSHATPPR
jgi:predicted N-acyltransferase